ncbi:MAG: hypothetical protein D6679_12055 [Candidatus Hydrogenedentota bacterium]|nr:MAG: hypothetical protein D6679_12055 [Candidatus Hydrogenedentota bacterium]
MINGAPSNPSSPRSHSPRPFLLSFAALLLPALSSCLSIPRADTPAFVSPKIARVLHAPVAVLPFKNSSGTLGADYLFTDEFNLRLGQTGLFRLVERVRVRDLYREQDLDPSRMSDTDAIHTGKMLGAKAVVLGTVTNYKSANRPPELPVDAFPVAPPTPASDEDAVVAAALANAVGALVTFLLMREPVAEVGATVRLVDTETGEIYWQARDDYRGDEERVKKRFRREEWPRLRKDVVYLAAVLAKDLANSLAGEWKLLEEKEKDKRSLKEAEE